MCNLFINLNTTHKSILQNTAPKRGKKKYDSYKHFHIRANAISKCFLEQATKWGGGMQLHTALLIKGHMLEINMRHLHFHFWGNFCQLCRTASEKHVCHKAGKRLWLEIENISFTMHLSPTQILLLALIKRQYSMKLCLLLVGNNPA